MKQLDDNYTNKLAAYKGVLDGLVNYKPLMDYIATDYDAAYEAIDDFNSKNKSVHKKTEG